MSIKEKPPIDPEKTNMWIFFFQLREMIVSEWNRTKKMTAVSLIELSSRAVVWWFDLAEVKLTLAAQGACAAPSLLLLLQLLFLIQCDWKYQGTWFLRNYLIFCRPSAHTAQDVCDDRLAILIPLLTSFLNEAPFWRLCVTVFWVSRCVALESQRHASLL